jgi:hypothetical protein
MPSDQEHLYKAENNKKVADGLKRTGPTAIGWAITILFYSALHYIEAFNAKIGSHFTKHPALCRYIEMSKDLSPISDQYNELKALSWNARYTAKRYDERHLKEAIESHEAVETHILNLL